MCKLSVLITAKYKNDQKLKDLLYSIEQQTFKDYEVIVVTEGDSESAKAIGIRKAKGEIVCILASDNYLNDKEFFLKCMPVPYEVGSFPAYYFYSKEDNILNRYFALFGCNDPIPFYLNKNDKLPYTYNNKYEYFYGKFIKSVPTLGDNGMFIQKNLLMKADIEHYYHIDVFQDLLKLGYNTYKIVNTSIWHRTGGNIFKFFIKRFKYADKFNTPYRRWHMVETKQDYLRLLWFIFCTITLIQPLYLSFKGYRVIKDKAWFLHPIVCWFTLITYGLWILKRLILGIFRHENNS
jgi:glycosyltransferase involved in cell wall biosynthesis